MQVTETLSEGLKRELKVTVPAADLEAEIEGRLSELSKTVTMKGFRPGKVPLSIVRRHYRPTVLGEVLQRTIETSSREVIEEQALRPALQPEIQVTAYDDGKDLEFTMGIEILPEIELGEFSDIAATRLRAEVNEQSVEETLGRIAEADKQFEAVAESRPAEEGDQLVIDFTVEIDGESVQDSGATDVAFELGADAPIPQLAEQLVGAEPGQDREVTITVPESDARPEFAGKTALFKVKVKELQARIPTAIDDALAERHGAQDLAGLRENVRERLQVRYEHASQARLKRSLLDLLDERHRFEVPAGMVEREFGAIWQQVEKDAEIAGVEIAEILDQPEEEARVEFRQIAERRVRLGLLISEIGHANNITVEREDLLKAALGNVQAYPEPQKLLDYYRSQPEALERFRPSVFEDKVIAFLSEIATVSEEVVDPETLLRDPEDDEERVKSETAATGESGDDDETA